MRVAACFIALVLSGCEAHQRYTSACDVSDPRAAIGSEVTFDAMLVQAGMESPPMVVDPRCWRGLPANMRDAPQSLKDAFNSAGNFNKFATVTGRLELFNNKPRLHITAARQVRVEPPMTEAQETAFFSRMIREGNAWTAAHPRTSAVR